MPSDSAIRSIDASTCFLHQRSDRYTDLAVDLGTNFGDYRRSRGPRHITDQARGPFTRCRTVAPSFGTTEHGCRTVRPVVQARRTRLEVRLRPADGIQRTQFQWSCRAFHSAHNFASQWIISHCGKALLSCPTASELTFVPERNNSLRLDNPAKGATSLIRVRSRFNCLRLVS